MAQKRRRNMRHNGNGSVWNPGTLVNVIAIVVGFICSMAAFYALTNWRLSTTEAGLAAETKTREGVEHEFGMKFDTMNDSLSKLNTHAAVQDQQTQMMNDTLKTISGQLTGLKR